MGRVFGALAPNVRAQEGNVQTIVAVGTILPYALNLQT